MILPTIPFFSNIVPRGLITLRSSSPTGVNPDSSSTAKSTAPASFRVSGLCSCGRRRLIQAAVAMSLFPTCSSISVASRVPSDYYTAMLEKVHPPRPDWYEEFYASVLNSYMQSYEHEISGYISVLFAQLKGKAEQVLEIGIGTGPNFRYYAADSGVRVFGVDPNMKMEKYAREAAMAAGHPPLNFEFIQAFGGGGVGGAIPLDDASADAVVGTLVLCSVKDVDKTLKETRMPDLTGASVFFPYLSEIKESAETRRVVPVCGACGCKRWDNPEVYTKCS